MATSRTLLVSTPRRAPRPSGATVRPVDRDGFPVLTVKEADILEFLYAGGVSLIPVSRDVSDAWRQARALETFGLVVLTPDHKGATDRPSAYKVPQHHAWTLRLSERGERCIAAHIARTLPHAFPRAGRK